jgi:hypothetical protein
MAHKGLKQSSYDVVIAYKSLDKHVPCRTLSTYPAATSVIYNVEMVGLPRFST